jgi:hypothetical protein
MDWRSAVDAAANLGHFEKTRLMAKISAGGAVGDALEQAIRQEQSSRSSGGYKPR